MDEPPGNAELQPCQGEDWLGFFEGGDGKCANARMRKCANEMYAKMEGDTSHCASARTKQLPYRPPPFWIADCSNITVDCRLFTVTCRLSTVDCQL